MTFQKELPGNFTGCIPKCICCGSRLFPPALLLYGLHSSFYHQSSCGKTEQELLLSCDDILAFIVLRRGYHKRTLFVLVYDMSGVQMPLLALSCSTFHNKPCNLHSNRYKPRLGTVCLSPRVREFLCTCTCVCVARHRRSEPHQWWASSMGSGYCISASGGR